jgi:hypothetical protein
MFYILTPTPHCYRGVSKSFLASQLQTRPRKRKAC